MLKIGVTGSLATGKSSVAAMFRQHGARVLDADRVVTQLISPKGKCFKKIVSAFGKGILSNGRINRARLAEIVFNNARKRKKLEAIIHPEVQRKYKQKLRELKKRQVKAVVFDVPLLFESGLHRLADVTVVVKANRDLQLKRSQSKKLTKSQAMKRIKAQWPITKKTKMADFVIDNRGSLNQTRNQVKRVWKEVTRINQN